MPLSQGPGTVHVVRELLIWGAWGRPHRASDERPGIILPSFKAVDLVRFLLFMIKGWCVEGERVLIRLGLGRFGCSAFKNVNIYNLKAHTSLDICAENQTIWQ